ncbi:glycosyltransferase family 2 protein [Candidatus Parcubacteria bacterium]|nr:glycosyltransferase family 2 protein [Candidatus Parcubacteria bacterium]
MALLPTCGESIEVLRTTFKSIQNNAYPLDKFIIVLAGEERKKAIFQDNVKILKKEFEGVFYKILFTLHPDNVAGEIKGKGANAHYAGHKSKEFIDELEIPYEDIIVSYFDCDTCAHPEYFSCVAYKYLTHPDALRTCYQPIVNYNNNIWDAPAAMRVTAFGTIFWLMTELLKPERMFTFSSHSMGYKPLVGVGFWQKDIVTDDSRIFLQGLMHYDGDFAVTPIYVPVSMDTVLAKSYWRSFVNLYKQQRRWAWGVEHFPYMLWHFLKNKKISFWKKFKYGWNLGEGMYSWATAPILIFVLGRLPLALAPETVQKTVVAQNAPLVLEWLMTFAMIGLLVAAILSVLILPPRPKTQSKYKILVMILQWIFLPVTLILFGCIPACEAQTRLMIGKYLGFWVTEKARK